MRIAVSGPCDLRVADEDIRWALGSAGFEWTALLTSSRPGVERCAESLASRTKVPMAIYRDDVALACGAEALVLFSRARGQDAEGRALAALFRAAGKPTFNVFKRR